MINYFVIFSLVLLISLSFVGYGSILSYFLDRRLLKINIGYLGLLGLFTCTLISYTTIIFIKHNYYHNILIHLVGIIIFFYFYLSKKNNFKINIKRFFTIFILLFIGLLILRNHDDFNYYHLTYSLVLTENKLIFGLGNLGHGYNHHSSVFFLNSIIFLPFIKHYLFHSIGWLTLFFVNLVFIDKLTNKNLKILDFSYFFYLFSFLFINFKFFRIGGYGTDLSGQIIMLTIIPLIYEIYKFKKVNEINNSNLNLSILLITYCSTLKSMMILNFLFLVPLLFFTKLKNLKYILLPKTILASLIGLFLLIFMNLSFTGCAVYPVKQTCLENKLEWSLSKRHVEKMNKFYQLWSKSGAGLNYKIKNNDEYIKKLNWVSNWYERYFTYKFKETLLGMFFLVFLVTFLYQLNINQSFKKIDSLSKRSIKIICIITSLLFLEWFLYHPALRYGGYHLLATLIFLPFSIFLAKKNINLKKKLSVTFTLIILSFFLFNYKNFKRIKEEFLIVKNHNFPLFYSPKQESTKIDIGNDISIYVPNDQKGCWTVKTPCTHYAGNVEGDSLGPFKMIKRKN